MSRRLLVSSWFDLQHQNEDGFIQARMIKQINTYLGYGDIRRFSRVPLDF